MINPEEVKSFDSLFVDTVKAKLGLYWQAKKVLLPKTSNKIEFYVGQEQPTARTEIAELNNWKNFETVDEIKGIVIELAEEVATVVDAFLRLEAGKYGNSKDVRNLFCLDLFEQVDDVRNLSFHVVVNSPISARNDDGSKGWVSYKFKWACGFPTKAESLYASK